MTKLVRSRKVQRDAGYSGTPLPKKLGIKPGVRVALFDAPSGFAGRLKPLPENAVIATTGKADLALLFTGSRAALTKGLAGAVKRLNDSGKLWLCWPKKASGAETDLSEAVVRQTGLAAGLVDFKVCAIDAFWSALCFARRKSP